MENGQTASKKVVTITLNELGQLNLTVEGGAPILYLGMMAIAQAQLLESLRRQQEQSVMPISPAALRNLREPPRN